jgi:hypothetical protein
LIRKNTLVSEGYIRKERANCRTLSMCNHFPQLQGTWQYTNGCRMHLPHLSCIPHKAYLLAHITMSLRSPALNGNSYLYRRQRCGVVKGREQLKWMFVNFDYIPIRISKISDSGIPVLSTMRLVNQYDTFSLKRA